MARRSVRTRVAVGAGRAAGRLSRLARRGQGVTISGRVTNALAPKALPQLAVGQRVILVSATNGKTTTTRMLAQGLDDAGFPVVSNSTGANLTSGITPALATATGPGFAVLEVDERVLPRVVDLVRPELVVLGNLSRDQLDRYGEVRAVSTAWRNVIEAHPEIAIVANASDPNVVWSAMPGRVTWVALGEGWRGDAATCPACGALLDASGARFRCPACGFSEPATTNRLEGKILTTADLRIMIELALPGAWNVANAALALTAAINHLDVDPAVAVKAVSRIDEVEGRAMLVPLADGRHARLLLAKNPAGWVEVLRHVGSRPGAAAVVAVNARIADGKDPSWLWDVPYEWLRHHPVAASGDRNLDVAVRLLYAGAEPVVERDPVAAASALPGDDVTIIASYTQFSALYRKFGTRSSAP